MSKTPKQYIEEYYEDYASGAIDQELETVSNFLIENTKGKVLDCGCGPVPQFWSVFMPKVEELYAIDLPQESIDFVKDKIKNVSKWCKSFTGCQKIVEEKIGKLPDDYIIRQVSKIKLVQQADMTKGLPFPNNYFDTVISLYSLGCLKDEKGLEEAIKNIKKALKLGGTLLHINTNGKNRNESLPSYTWNGLSQSSDLIKKYLAKNGFTDISVKRAELSPNDKRMYKYDNISLLMAVKVED